MTQPARSPFNGFRTLRRRGAPVGGGGGATIPTTAQSSVNYNGVTWSFNSAVPVGFFEDGSPFVVASSAFQITGTTPASVVVNGGWAHGMGVNFYSEASQPFDQFIASGNASADVPYSGNIDPGATASAISVAAGALASYIKATRLASVTAPTGQWQTIDKYSVLTVLPVAPPAGSYRPGVASLTKPMLNKNTFNPAALRSLTLPASFTDTTAQALAKVPADHLGIHGHNGERRRRFRTDVALGTTTSNYSRDLAPAYGDLILQLHRTGLSVANRDAILARIAVHASDLAGVVERGFPAQAGRYFGAGQAGAMQPWLFAAAFCFNSSSYLATARAFSSNMLANAFWISAGDVGIAANGKSGSTAQTYFPEHVGEPWIVPDEETSNADGRYTLIAGSIMAREIPPVALFQSGPGGVSGLTAILNGPNDSTNPRAAAVSFVSRYLSYTPSVMLADNPDTPSIDLHAQVSGLVSGYAWTGKVAQLPYANQDTGSFNDDIFAGASGSITWSINAYGNWGVTGESVIGNDIRYSLDGRQWVEINGQAAAGTISGLLSGAAHFCGIRRESASGKSAWTRNHPRLLPFTGTPRGRPTTTGTPANTAPVNTVAPIIVRRAYPLWDWPDWVPAPSTLASVTEELAAGVGYWTGFPAPTFTFQWKRNGVALAGETSAVRGVKFADNGTSLTCDVTGTNGSGNVTLTTPAIAVPSAGSTGYERVDNNARAFLIGWEAPPTGTQRQVTFAFKGRLLAGDAAFRTVLMQNTNTQPLNVQIRTNNALRLSMRNAVGTEILRVDSATAFAVALGEFTYVLSVNLATGVRQSWLYSSGAWASSTSGTDLLTVDDINFAATTEISAFGGNTGLDMTDMEADYICLHNSFIDFSILGNREAFRTTGGLGADGSIPFGTTPMAFFTGPKALIEAGLGNRGAKGQFRQAASLSGTIATTATSVNVVGTGTAFTTELVPGDSITTGVNTRVVEEVLSDTSLTVTAAYAGTASGLKPRKANAGGNGSFT
jgi:hypothetical protein